MVNVDNLNFKVIIDDKQFNQKIKAMEDMAKKFNTSMSNLLNVQAVSQQLVVSNRKRLQMETDLVRATEMQNREKIKTEGLQRKINAQIERTSKGYQSQSRILQELKGYALGYLSIHGASQLLSSLVRVTGEFELQKTTLAAMLGDLNKAEGIITRIQGLAVESPFQFKELTTYAKQLSAFSVPAQELYDTTKMLADISAGLGVGMDRIVLAYGQVRSAAFLRGQEVRQFTEAGIPILDELAKQFTELEGRAVSTGEVFDKISARLVPFEMVAKVFKDMTSEGGKFYNMQEVQAETLRGKISNLKDAYEVMLNEIGSGQSEKLKGAVDWARRLMQNYEETGRTLVELVAAYGIYRTTLSLTSNHITPLTRAHTALRAQMRNLTKLLTKNPYAALAVGVTAAIGLIYKLGKEMKSQSAISETLSKSQSEYAKNVEESTVALDALYAKINLAKKGTKDYNTALGTIQRTYAPYIEQLRSEGVEVDNLATLYGELTKKIKESAQARFVESARKDLDQTYAQGLSDILNGTGANEIYNLKRAMESLDLNEAEGVVLRMFLSGSATWDEISEKYGELAKKVEGAYVSLGAGSTGPMKAKDYLDILKNSLTNLTNQYTTAIAVVDEFAIKMKETPYPVVLATGWRKTVQDTLTGMGLNKGTSFGLWAEDTTQSTEYVDDMIKRYKELGEQIKNVSSFDPDQTERLKKNKEAIEAIAKELGILDLLTEKQDSKREKTETDYRIRALKREAEVIKEAMETYEKWMDSGFFTDDVARELLGKIYGDTQAFKEGVTTYTEGMVDALKDSEALRLKVYQNKLKDKNGKEYLDVPTVGWGHTGKDVNKLGVGTVITKEQADQWLKEDLARLTSDLNDVLQDFGVSLNQAQYDALAHMVFNTGKGGIEDLFKKSMDELGKVDLDKVAENILTHRTNNGTKALVDRRLKEYEMFTNDVGVAVSEDGKLMTNFDEMLNRVILRLQALGEKGKEAAAVLQSAFDKSSRKEEANDVYESYEKQYKAVSKYYEMLRKWTAEDFNINGEGIAFDVSKIASDLNEKIKEIELRSTKAKKIFDQIDVDSEQEVAKVKDIFVKEFGADAWEEFWQSYQSEGFKAIENLADKQKEYEKKVAQEKLTDVAKKFAKEKLEPLNLTDWGDKSLGQIKRIQESLKSLLVNPVVFPPEVQEQVDSLGLSMDDLYEIVKAIFGENYKDVLDEKLKKIQDRAKNAVTALGDIGGAFSNIGSAIGSEALENIGLYIDGVEEVVSALVDCDYLWEQISKMMDKTSEASEEAADSIDDIASSTDWITVILKVVLVLAEQISNAVAIAEEGTWALRKAAMEYQEVLHEIALEQADTIWGENYTRKLKEGFDYVKTTYEAYHNYIKRLMQEDFGGVKQRSFNLNDNSWDWLVIKDFAGLVDMYDLMDEAGNLDMDWIKGNLDALIKSTAYNGLKLKKYLEQDLEHLVELYDDYQKAYAEIKSTIQEMMSETANDFADNMIDSFLRVGDAADDLGKVFENLGTTLIKTFMVDFLIDNVLGRYTNELTDLFEKKALGAIGLEEFNEKFADIAGRIETDIADYAPMFNDLLAKAQSSGLLSSDIAEETASLASGIKGVTEDTANLLASYLNAIRADVSYAKGQREQSNAYLQQILTQVSAMNAPSLVEYQQQIAANTFNTAIATQAILSRLDSVITSEGGFDAIRTYS